MKIDSKVILHFNEKYHFDISFVQEKYLNKAFCVNYYELKPQINVKNNYQLCSNLEYSNRPLAIIGEKVLALIKSKQLFALNSSLDLYDDSNKREQVALLSSVCDKLDLFQFAYIQVIDEINFHFEGDDGNEKRSSIVLALIGAMFVSLTDGMKNINPLIKFINRFVN